MPQLMSPDAVALVFAASQIAAAIAVLNGFTVGIGQGNIGAKAIESIARQPEAKGSITSTMFISCALAETSGIYGLLISFILLFANPLLSRYLALIGA
ncbi:MAG: ATP synthase F0 subunit C [Oscillospiraceae bacterium]|nr:ATP synthase F0 subunit C [Oscillospiraceae bacterium]